MSGRRPDAVRMAAPAKINLYLHVTGKREDGYHILDSLAAFAGIHDLIVATPSTSGIHLDVEGDFADRIPAGEDNLVMRVAKALADDMGVAQGARILLNKRLPPASGVGGGSADAAATIKALTTLWGIDPSGDRLMELALRFGADIPVCLMGRTAFMGGVGEELEPAPPLPQAWLVLVNPGVEVSTPEVFRRRHGPFSEPARFSDAPAAGAAFAKLLAERRNDLTDPAIEVAPVVGEVLSAIAERPGVQLARMSGSGATCFGLFADASRATDAAMALQRAHPDWWVKAASLESDATRLGM